MPFSLTLKDLRILRCEVAFLRSSLPCIFNNYFLWCHNKITYDFVDALKMMSKIKIDFC